MEDEINSLSIDDIKEFGFALLHTIPSYFFTAPASSSGKYHPQNDLGEGGLVRHSISVRKMLRHLLEPNGYYNFSVREIELLELATLFHDCFKSGSQLEYEANIHTKFIHPVLAANHIIMEAVNHNFDYESANFIASAIISHMGQWNTNHSEPGTLPLPNTPAQKVLHLADYLASRKDINMDIPDPYKSDPDAATASDEQKGE